MDRSVGDLVAASIGAGDPAPGPHVLVDASGEPYKVVSAGNPTPAVVIPAATTLNELAASFEVIRMVRDGASGLVVVDEGRVVGFLTRRVIVAELVRIAPVRGTDPFDTQLHGEARPLAGAVRVRCLTCGHINRYDYYLPGELADCANGHPLDADLD
ncbi:hypothetical protein [Nonomuraea sp. NPDC049400]|uniref:hypothetical protein n=1 Tax=Nonomuraea sp. NPDC049400 TaxID=3364352 RepID=UPI00378EBAA4